MRWIHLQLLRAWWRYTLYRDVARRAVRTFRHDWDQRDALLHLQMGFGRVDGLVSFIQQAAPEQKKGKRSKWRKKKAQQ